MGVISSIKQTLERILRNPKSMLRSLSQKSIGWFKAQIKSLRSKKFDKRSFIIADKENLKRNIVIGRMYLFAYDPKLKKVLPVWDKFPLILPFSFSPDGFTAINLHYMPYNQRAFLLKALLGAEDFKDVKKTMKISYNILMKFSSVKENKYIIHKYLYSHVVSPFKLINQEDYAEVIMLPMAEFYGPLAKQFKDLY